MDSTPWLIIGISGISCSGKTTLASAVYDHFNETQIQTRLLRDKCIQVEQVKLIRQDDYFHSIDSVQHVWIPELNHINREHLGALNNEKMCKDLDDILGKDYVAYTKRIDSSDGCSNGSLISLNIMIIDGYLVFNQIDINRLIQVRLCMQISFEDCLARRVRRIYPQPTPSGYFEQYVWPIYQTHFAVYKSYKNLLILEGGTSTKDHCASQALEWIYKFL